MVGAVIQLADIDDIRPQGARQYRKIVGLAVGSGQLGGLSFWHGFLRYGPLSQFLSRCSKVQGRCHKINGRFCINYAGSSSFTRAITSLRPKMEATSKTGGEYVLPVSAARNGWASSPSFTPRSSANPRAACSSDAALKSPS